MLKYSEEYFKQNLQPATWLQSSSFVLFGKSKCQDVSCSSVEPSSLLRSSCHLIVPSLKEAFICLEDPLLSECKINCAGFCHPYFQQDNHFSHLFVPSLPFPTPFLIVLTIFVKQNLQTDLYRCAKNGHPCSVGFG